jgi:hypothetical protein
MGTLRSVGNWCGRMRRLLALAAGMSNIHSSGPLGSHSLAAAAERDRSAAMR